MRETSILCGEEGLTLRRSAGFVVCTGPLTRARTIEKTQLVEVFGSLSRHLGVGK